MDEELDGINPNSFFEQLTEVRETAQSAQKISNSNLSLLNELRSKVEIISNDLRLLKNEAKDKAFEEEDRKQKEKLENRAKSIAGESQGSGEDIEKEQEDPEKGLLGQIGDFISNLFGGIVGGIAGLAISGIGGLIDLGTRAASSAKRIGTGIADALTFNMFDFDGKGKPDKKNLSSIMGGDKDYEKNRKKNLDLKKEVKKELEDDLGVGDKEKAYKKNRRGGKDKDLKEEIKGELKEELGIGDKLKETGKNILGGIKKTFGGIKDAIGNFDGRPGSRKTKGGDVKPEETFSTSIKYSTKGNAETGELEVDPNSLEPGVPLIKAEQHFYKSKISELQFEIRNSKREFGDDYDTSFMEKELKKFQKKYNDTLEFGGYDLGDGKTNEKKGSKKRNIFGFNQGGEVDSVPAMLTPGEFVVTKDAVDKVGVDTLKGLNASVGATSKPSLLGSIGTDKEGNLKTFTKIGDKTESELTSADGSFTMRNVTDMSGGGLDETTTTSYNKTFTEEDGTVTTLEEKQIMRERISSIGVPDLIEHKDQLLGEIHKLKGFENVTIDQVINSATGIPKDKLLDILLKSDAQKATSEKEDKAREEDLKARGIKPGQGFNISANDEIGRSLAGTMGYRMGQINPDTLVTSTTDFLEKSKSTSGVKPKSDPLLSDLSASINASVKGYNQGGLVGSSITPIIESQNESGEMELIKNLSQSVDSNRQTLIVKEEQEQVMNPPNQNPNPVALADAPQTAPAELQDTEAPIPFASLLRQSAQRYLNLGNNAMVIS